MYIRNKMKSQSEQKKVTLIAFPLKKNKKNLRVLMLPWLIFLILILQPISTPWLSASETELTYPLAFGHKSTMFMQLSGAHETLLHLIRMIKKLGYQDPFLNLRRELQRQFALDFYNSASMYGFGIDSDKNFYFGRLHRSFMIAIPLSKGMDFYRTKQLKKKYARLLGFLHKRFQGQIKFIPYKIAGQEIELIQFPRGAVSFFHSGYWYTLSGFSGISLWEFNRLFAQQRYSQVYSKDQSQSEDQNVRNINFFSVAGSWPDTSTLRGNKKKSGLYFYVNPVELIELNQMMRIRLQRSGGGRPRLLLAPQLIESMQGFLRISNSLRFYLDTELNPREKEAISYLHLYSHQPGQCSFLYPNRRDQLANLQIHWNDSRNELEMKLFQNLLANWVNTARRFGASMSRTVLSKDKLRFISTHLQTPILLTVFLDTNRELQSLLQFKLLESFRSKIEGADQVNNDPLETFLQIYRKQVDDVNFPTVIKKIAINYDPELRFPVWKVQIRKNESENKDLLTQDLYLAYQEGSIIVTSYLPAMKKVLSEKSLVCKYSETAEENSAPIRLEAIPKNWTRIRNMSNEILMISSLLQNIESLSMDNYRKGEHIIVDFSLSVAP